MHLTVRSHHATVDDRFQGHAEKKLQRLSRLLPRLDDVVVEVAHQETRAAADRYAVQVTVHAGASILRAEERGADPVVALDLAADVLSRQARRHKKRLHDRHSPAHSREGQAAKEIVADRMNTDVEPMLDEPGDEEEYLLGKVVRVKHFEAKPMSQEEALAQMDLLGHDFFLFLDASTRDYALLYKRRDGDYGLLSPRRTG
jgi:putative sigma-54 modulation protein